MTTPPELDMSSAPMQTGVPTTSVQSVDRAVHLLETVAGSGPEGLSLKDVTDQVGLRTSTGRTLLASLAAHGLVAQNSRTRRYFLGPRFFELNRAYVTKADLSIVAAPVLQELWEQTQETVYLSVLHGTRRVDIATLACPQMLNVNPAGTAGTAEPTGTPYRAAVEKILLTGLNTRERCDLLAIAPWPKVPDEQAMSALLDELDQVKSQGYATNIEEVLPGVCGVAAPVVDQGGSTIAALCIGYPSVRHNPARHTWLRRAVVEHAAKLSSRLGASPSDEAIIQ